ncbi:AGE family epimerase/isomerase [Balneolales bacterium ANBcel1]|nr:AGE family epimerase/isomerase [Balneolales bacterium ANBcel1]
MSLQHKLARLSDELSDELQQHILPFWMNRMIDDHGGGFHGALDHQADPVASDKSGVLNTRILWTFSAAYRLLRDPSYLVLARRALLTVRNDFWDPVHGGIFWSVAGDGTVRDNRKHIYTQAFAIYGLAEYYLACRDDQALALADSLFDLIEKHAYRDDGTGYHEAFSNDWQPMDDTRLGSNDIHAARTFNTHLHLLEAFTHLYRARPDDLLKDRLAELIAIHIDSMYDADSRHILSYFDENLNPVSPRYSYGHDIEAAWLLYDAAAEIGNNDQLESCSKILFDLADITITEGSDPAPGGICDTGERGDVADAGKQWWAQAEALTGYLYAYLLSADEKYISEAERVWDFTKKHFVDRENGEWYFRLDAAGKPDLSDHKAGPWKCPYHTSRTCLLYTALAMDTAGNTPFTILHSKKHLPVELP